MSDYPHESKGMINSDIFNRGIIHDRHSDIIIMKPILMLEFCEKLLDSKQGIHYENIKNNLKNVTFPDYKCRTIGYFGMMYEYNYISMFVGELLNGSISWSHRSKRDGMNVDELLKQLTERADTLKTDVYCLLANDDEESPYLYSSWHYDDVYAAIHVKYEEKEIVFMKQSQLGCYLADSLKELR